jgi:excisionase family DNA binding protein
MSDTHTAARRRRREAPRPEPVTHTINDTCAVTGLGRTRIYELLADGSLESVRLGRRRLVTRRSIEALVARSLG